MSGVGGSEGDKYAGNVTHDTAVRGEAFQVPSGMHITNPYVSDVCVSSRMQTTHIFHPLSAQVFGLWSRQDERTQALAVTGLFVCFSQEYSRVSRYI